MRTPSVSIAGLKRLAVENALFLIHQAAQSQRGWRAGDDIVEQAKRETERGFQPEIEPIDVTAYDTVVVGTPTWWYTMAPAVARFFSDNEWAGKTVSNFMTNAGWPGTVIEDMEAACQPATLGPSLEVLFDSAAGSTQLTSDDDIDAWIESLREF